jgi:mannose-6-phosphate isomerase-like protein (cupin superfamily)
MNDWGGRQMDDIDKLMIRPGEGRSVWLGGLGVRFLLGGDQTGGRYSLVEHPMQPRALGAPMHTHQHEDEYSFVLEGEVGVQIGDREMVATPGTLVVKPRGVPHAFWNAGDQPARLLEFISPAGFEHYFEEVAAAFAVNPPDIGRAAELWQKYGLDMDMSSLPRLVQSHGLNAGGPTE